MQVVNCQSVSEVESDNTYRWYDAGTQQRQQQQLQQQDERRRRRAVTRSQRLVANSRERRRVSLLNAAFDALRCHVPVFAYERRPSRRDTLRLAARYIAIMTQLLTSRTA